MTAVHPAALIGSVSGQDPQRGTTGRRGGLKRTAPKHAYTLSFKVASWQNGVNCNVEGRTVRRGLGYNGNGAHFRRTTDEVARGGYQEFAFR
jgi:hypothetical protein